MRLLLEKPSAEYDRLKEKYPDNECFYYYYDSGGYLSPSYTQYYDSNGEFLETKFNGHYE
jgi:hypothetical protein